MRPDYLYTDADLAVLVNGRGDGTRFYTVTGTAVGNDRREPIDLTVSAPNARTALLIAREWVSRFNGMTLRLAEASRA